MHLEEYTADTICHAMNLSGFIDSSWAQAESPTLRVVLTPSFHPELCISVTRTTETNLMSIVALTERLWAKRAPVCLPHDDEQLCLSSLAYTELIEMFQAAHKKFDPERKYLCIDGMGSESCLVSKTGTWRLHAHISTHEETRKFITRLLEFGWQGTQNPRVRNALANAASYLGVEYPLQQVPPSSPTTHIAVLGIPEDRHEFLDFLKRQKHSER
jgi:hypothetical protein